MKILQPKLSKGQYKYFVSSVKTFAEGILLGSSAAFFLPEVFQLKEAIPFIRYFLISIIGLLILFFGAILEKKGE